MKKTNIHKIVIRRKAKKILTCAAKRITFYALVGIVALVGLSSCKGTGCEDKTCERADIVQTPGGDTLRFVGRWVPIQEYIQARACEVVLDLCEYDGILDKAGAEAYHRMKDSSQYIELIKECEKEDSFNDVIGGTDAYEHYLDVCAYAYTK